MLLNKKTCSTCDNYDGWACKIDGFIMGGSADACKAYRAMQGTDTGEPHCGTGEPNCGTSVLSKYRHKMAERVRMMHRFTPYISFHAIVHQAMKEMLPEEIDYCEVFADLIDIPTCTVVNWEQLVTQGLDELELDDMFRYDLSCGHEMYGDEKPHYCSKCGAAVVDE